jgi:hypothetical protein
MAALPSSSSSSSSTLDTIFRLLKVANDLEEKKENRIEAATKVRLEWRFLRSPHSRSSLVLTRLLFALRPANILAAPSMMMVMMISLRAVL